MNYLTNVRNTKKLTERELALGIVEDGSASKTSWHNDYKDSAWVYIGGLDYGLTEGDVIAKTGKSKGFAFVCYEDQRSAILAVDNLNGINVCNRTMRIDHVANYKIPKEFEDQDEITKKLHAKGCAPKLRHKHKRMKM
ncbi:RBMX2 [Cordylochernes scorpioides]|uniref:RBMX2 n=1 Tax=Cordylochernes scorpioides TaxID=51811 RepID=A0ABY6LLC2_9ARAC|nr:RBMX2 [Cordylochernes scorpioides]